MNTGVVTIGLIPLVIGSSKIFQLKATLDGVFWDLTGGTVTLTLKSPAGDILPIGTQIINGVAQASWRVISPVGQWTRAWSAIDSNGIPENSEPIVFNVIGYP